MLCPLCEKDPCTCNANDATTIDAKAQPVDSEEMNDRSSGRDQILQDFENIPDKPTPQQIAAWKQQFGDVYIFGFRADEIYVWRPLLRLEYRQLRSNTSITEDLLKEEIVRRCVLWPRLAPEFTSTCKAGTIDTLFEVIMHGSNFVDPILAVELVRRL